MKKNWEKCPCLLSQCTCQKHTKKKLLKMERKKRALNRPWISLSLFSLSMFPILSLSISIAARKKSWPIKLYIRKRKSLLLIRLFFVPASILFFYFSQNKKSFFPAGIIDRSGATKNCSVINIGFLFPSLIFLFFFSVSLLHLEVMEELLQWHNMDLVLLILKVSRWLIKLIIITNYGLWHWEFMSFS